MANKIASLADLFIAMFKPQELRVFLLRLPDADAIATALPPVSSSRETFGFEVVLLLERLGRVDANLFRRLAERAGTRRANVLEVASQWGVSSLDEDDSVAEDAGGSSLSTLARGELAKMLMLGFQMGRYEFAWDSTFEEAKAVGEQLDREIRSFLSPEFRAECTEIAGKALMEAITRHFMFSDARRHAALMIGFGGLRATLVGASSDTEHNTEMAELALSCFGSIDSVAVPDALGLGRKVVAQQPSTVMELRAIVDAHLA